MTGPKRYLDNKAVYYPGFSYERMMRGYRISARGDD